MAVIKNKWVEKIKKKVTKGVLPSDKEVLVSNYSKQSTTSAKAMHRTLSGLRK